MTTFEKELTNFMIHLHNEEKSESTCTKYKRDICDFLHWLSQNELCKETVLAYKSKLVERYSPASVNSKLSSLNSFFNFINRFDCKVRFLKIQRQIFASKERELTKSEYHRLIRAANHNMRLKLLMQTICSTGIRVSELQFITVEAAKKGRVSINCKGKMRVVMLTPELCKELKKYVRSCNIISGSIFITRSGKPLDRSNIWSEMKKLCKRAGVEALKVFPHNLRHLFARTYYSIQKDIVRLADILGHSNINTTRIYTAESGEQHMRQLRKLGLLFS